LETNASRPPDQVSAAAGEPRGLAAELLSLLGSVGRHVSAVGALAGEEARGVAELYLRLAVMLGAAIFFAAFGYVLLLLFVAFLVATVFHVAWIWILLAFTVVHFLVAVLCATHVKNHWRTPLFPATAAEIKKDLEALKPRP